MKKTKKQIVSAILGGLAIAAVCVFGIRVLSNMAEQAANEIRQWDGLKVRVEIQEKK